MAAGALWNSLVVVVKAKTLLTMARCYLPQLFAPFWRIREALGRPEEPKVLAAEYERMPSVAFSRGLLEQKPPNLVVLPVKESSGATGGMPRGSARPWRGSVGSRTSRPSSRSEGTGRSRFFGRAHGRWIVAILHPDLSKVRARKVRTCQSNGNLESCPPHAASDMRTRASTWKKLGCSVHTWRWTCRRSKGRTASWRPQR